MGVSRRTREEIVKWNQMTAETPDRGETSDIPGLPPGTQKRGSAVSVGNVS